MKKVMLLTIFAALMMFSSAAFAQAGVTASGTLTVNATVNGVLQLVFTSDGAGVVLTSGAGTNVATLDFGTVQAFGGTLKTGVTRSVGATSWTISTPVDVQVNKANVTSANYTLKAQLGTADAVNTWQVAGTTVTSTAQATLTATGTYGAVVAETIAITIPLTAPSGAITNTINYVASSN